MRALIMVACWALPAFAAERLNVLMIAVDDLKPALACAGDPHAKTPNIDALARRGTVFTRAYCQQAVCSPSRSSLMTGRRPDSTKVYDLVTHFRKALPDVVTFTQHFKNNGYYCHGVGKIYHGGYDDKPSWSVPWEATKGANYGPEGKKEMVGLRAAGKEKDESKIRGLPAEAADSGDDDLNDGWTANRIIEIMKGRQAQAEPFFLAMGMAKPHLPFVAPKKYWDLYDPAKLPMPELSHAPAEAPAFAPSGWGELRAYSGIPKTGALSESQTRHLIHGYYAAVSYMDAQVGKVLAALDATGFAKNTVVVLWGDHGWHLGDHGMWCKHTNYEQATRAALVMAMPGQKVTGTPSAALVEFVDIYPTLADACQLPKPAGVEGYSFLPLLDQPDKTWKVAAMSQYPRPGQTHGPLMGYAVRTVDHRYVEWRKRGGTEVVARELYDLKTDAHESKNIAAAQADIVDRHAKILAAGWQGNAPPK